MALLTKQSISTSKALLVKTKQTGFTIIELIVAMALFLIVVPGILTLVWANQEAVINAAQKREALNLAQSILDDLKIESTKNFSDIKSYHVNSPIYQTAINVTQLNLYTKQVVVEISWTNNTLVVKKVSLTAVLTDRLLALSGNICLTVPDSSPAILESNLSLGNGNDATGIIVRNNLAYITTDSRITTLEDFFIVDVTNVKQPVVIGKLDTGPGLSSLTVVGKYAYVGNTSINAQLQIIDISDPRNPLLKKVYKLPGNYTDNTTIANTLAYDHGIVYLGTRKSQIAELHAINVANPDNLTELGSFEVDAGINSIAINGSHAYVASPAPEELKILDIKDPSKLRQINFFDAIGGSGNGKSLAVVGDTLILGRTVGNDELYILNAADPNNIVELSSKSLDSSINSMAVVPGWLYLTTTDPPKSLQIWNISNLASPTLAKFSFTNGTATAIACGKNHLYVATQLGLAIIKP